ncbi:hypothetical protein Tco_1336877 [Tanacetum coccineum]
MVYKDAGIDDIVRGLTRSGWFGSVYRGRLPVSYGSVEYINVSGSSIGSVCIKNSGSSSESGMVDIDKGSICIFASVGMSSVWNKVSMSYLYLVRYKVLVCYNGSVQHSEVSWRSKKRMVMEPLSLYRLKRVGVRIVQISQENGQKLDNHEHENRKECTRAGDLIAERSNGQ